MASKAITIDLGDMADHAQRHLRDGYYESLDDVMQAAVRALDREKAAFDEMIRRKVQEALDDPRPSIPADEAFRSIRQRIARRSEG